MDMKTILEIIGIACFAWLFAEGSGLVQRIRHELIFNHFIKPKAQLKPFSCPLCLGFWSGLAYFAINQEPLFIFYAAICSVIATLISKFTRI